MRYDVGNSKNKIIKKLILYIIIKILILINKKK